MQPRIDPLGKVLEMYNDGSRQVPYLTFMHVFNDLLEDPLAVVPKEPSDELKDTFRAACMAASIGVTDTEGRAAQRLKEFQTKVLPLWKDKLGRKEFRQFEDVIRGGGLRRRRALAAREKSTSFVAANEKSSALLRRLQLVSQPDDERGEPSPAVKPWQQEADAEPVAPSEPEQPVPVPPAQPAPKPEPPWQADDRPTEAIMEHVSTFESMSALCKALHDGRLKPETGDGGSVEFARYQLSGQRVAVKLARSGQQHYVVLAVAVGHASLAGGLEAMDVMAGAMGYLKMAQGAYMRKDDEYVHTLKAGPARISMASAAPPGDREGHLVTQLTRLQWDLGELLERMDVR